MRTDETKERETKAKSADSGFAQMGQRMHEMISACCEGQDVSPDCCSSMMKGMMEMMGSQPCCAPKMKDAQLSKEKK